MVSYFIHRFVPDYQNLKSAKVRYHVCRVCSYIGIALNLFLFLSKYMIGVAVHSIAIQADGFNNLIDAGSNIVSIISFHLSEKPADKGHPYGHERIETVTSLFVGLAIAFVGFELIRDSVSKIIHPEPTQFSWTAIGVLALSIAVKLYMFFYNSRLGNKYGSTLLKANALDSRSDAMGTLAVLIGTLLSPVLHFDLDPYLGVGVACLIFYSAYELLRDVINKLLGEAPDPDNVNKLVSRVMDSPLILSVHDVIFHMYGQNSVFATAHAEVDASLSLVQVHDEVDKLERRIKDEMDIDLTIHVDPIELDDPRTRRYIAQVEYILGKKHPDWSMHDFHIVDRKHGPHVYFDLMVPFSEKRTEAEIEKEFAEVLKDENGTPLHVTINLDHPYD